MKTTHIEEKDGHFHITITVPRKKSGTYTYEEGTWTVDNVCVWINDKYQEYALCHTQYLDYKDSLQATQPIIFFNSKEEAEQFAEKHDLPVEYLNNL